MKVPFNDLKRIHEPLRTKFHEILDGVLDNSSFVGDINFSEEFSKYTGSVYGVSCNSGTDALYIAIIEDCAQAHGATINGKHVGTIGNIGCFSMYPGKNLGALGDAGVCITNNETLSIKMKQYTSLGAQKDNRYNHITDGINSRMDGIQGLFLKEKLKHLDIWTKDRIRIGEIYSSSNNAVKRSTIGKDVYHVYYTLKDDRDDYIKYMNENGIQTGIHYPISLPELECFKKYTGSTICINAKEFCKKCVSLPLFPYMTTDEIDFTLKCHIDYHLREL